MKQAELNKLLSAGLRKSAKAHDWNYSRGFVFKATELLFFSLIILGQVKRQRLFYTLRYKLLAFDDLFWKIVRLEENLKQPLSFRAFGAWTAPTAPISEGELPIASWDAANLDSQVNHIIDRCDLEVERVSSAIHCLDDNLGMIEILHARLKIEHPDALTNIWRERLLTSILKNDFDRSRAIVADRLNARDYGGFQVGSESFYELANEYLRTIR